MIEHYCDRLNEAIKRCGTPAVVGIDPVIENLPPMLKPRERSLTAAVAAIENFSRGVINAVAGIVPAVKINAGFFEALYAEGLAAYFRTVRHAHDRGLLVIGDVKRTDIGSTAALYARGHLDTPPFDDVDPAQIPDAITLSASYLGEHAARPFIDTAARTGRGLYLLVRPSDPGADEVHEFGAEMRLYEFLADLVHRWGYREELLGQCGQSCVGAVIAPKDYDSTEALREMLPHTPWLVPGYGAQGATAESCRPCFFPDGAGAVINASRSVIYACSKPDYAARFGDDWTGAVAAACRAFADDVAVLLQPV